MLPRRFGLALKSYWPERGSAGDTHSAEEWNWPLERITPEGTVGDAWAAGGCAFRCHGHRWVRHACARASSSMTDVSWGSGLCRRLSGSWQFLRLRGSLALAPQPAGWSRSLEPQTAVRGMGLARPPGGAKVTEQVAAVVVEQIDDDTDPAELCRIVLTALHAAADTADLKALAKSSALIRFFLAATAQATHATDLARLVRGTPRRSRPAGGSSSPSTAHSDTSEPEARRADWTATCRPPRRTCGFVNSAGSTATPIPPRASAGPATGGNAVHVGDSRG